MYDHPSRTLSALVSIIAFALLVLIVPGCDSGGDKGPGRGGSVMDEVATPEARAIPFTVSTFDKGEFTLTEAPGRPTVVNFWASWCGPCRLEAPVLQRAFEKYSPKGVAFIGVAIQDNPEGSVRFIREFNIKFPNGPDATGQIMRDYRVFGIPKTYVIAPDGKVAYSHTGPVTFDGLSTVLDKLL